MTNPIKPRKGSARRVPTHAESPIVPTVVEFLLDETGSMSSVKAATISGFNTFLAEQTAQTGTCLLTLTKFDTSGLKTPYVDLDVRMVLPMTENTFVPGQSTNLRDAIGARVRALETRLAHWTVRPHVLVVVMTDGDDNASHAYSVPQINDLIRAHEAEGWTFVYLGSTSNALRVAENLGFAEGNAKRFEASEMHETMVTLAQATTAYRASRQDGHTVAEKQYFAR